METKKIKIIETKGKTLFHVDGYNHDRLLANGKPLEKTFRNGWYVLDGKLNTLQEKSTIRINERWELVDKELYNESLPLLIDEHSKEKYINFINKDLYKYCFETKDVLIDVNYEIIEATKINEEILFETKVEFKKWDSIKREWVKEHYLIDELVYSFVDNCLTPSPVKELTSPCLLKGNLLFYILKDYIKRNIDLNKAKITSDYDFIFEVRTRSDITLFKLGNETDYVKHYGTTPDLVGSNFNDLLTKLENLKKAIIKHINQGVCPHCQGRGYINFDFNIKDYL